MHIITAIVRMLHKLEAALDLPENTLVKKLTARIHNLCSSLETKHTTMIRFSHQSVVHLFENLTTKNKKGKKQSPIVDATDMQKLMLNLPYLLDGLADEELRLFNTNHPAGRGKLSMILFQQRSWLSTIGCSGTSYTARRRQMRVTLSALRSWGVRF